jgi:transposase
VQDDSITIVLGLPELRVVGKEETGQEIRVDVEYRRQMAVCPRCGQMTAKVHSISMQTKRDRRLWDKPVYLVLRKRRFCCLCCGKVFTEPDTVCGARRRTSERFRRQLGEEAIDQPVRHVARRERVGEALVRRCFTEEARLWLEASPQVYPHQHPGHGRVLGEERPSV